MHFELKVAAGRSNSPLELSNEMIKACDDDLAAVGVHPASSQPKVSDYLKVGTQLGIFLYSQYGYDTELKTIEDGTHRQVESILPSMYNADEGGNTTLMNPILISNQMFFLEAARTELNYKRADNWGDKVFRGKKLGLILSYQLLLNTGLARHLKV